MPAGVYIRTKETKKKMSEVLKGNKRCLDYKHTAEARKKMSEAKKGRKRSPETKKKISDAQKGNKYALGYKHTEEAKRKQGEANKGENNPSWKGGKKRRNTVEYKLNRRISNGIWYSLKENKNNKSWQDLVPYNVKQLKNHLKKTIPEGYTWQNFLKGELHIDHIIPRSAFEFDKPKDLQFQQCWVLENLQLLPALENLIKHNKIIKPFQTALKI